MNFALTTRAPKTSFGPQRRALAAIAMGHLITSGAITEQKTNDTPIIIEFEAELEQVAIDGKDCLYTVFQMGDPARTGKFLRAAFGEKGLAYAERAWQTENQRTRIALCDLTIHDPEVVAAHHLNVLVIAGRYRTVFRSAFTLALPILTKDIINVWVPEERPYMPNADVYLADLLPPLPA
jgi:hypothetical protein